MRAVNSAHIDRFRDDLSALINPQHMQLGVAVSGGGDSLALLLLAHAAFSGRVSAATVDHQLRPEARAEAEFVAERCRELGVAHIILTPSAPISGSLQAGARVARYAALERWADEAGCSVIATAHHIDDQAETLLMRLNRGAGVAGLAGIRAQNGRIIRPVLGWRRAELAAVVADAGWDSVDDPSNHDANFDRVAMRQHVANSDWLDVKHLARSAALLAEANTALDWAADDLIKTRLVFGANSVKFDPILLPRELRRRLTLRALRHIDPNLEPRGEALVGLIEALGRGETRTLGQALIRGGAIWRFAPAQPRRKN